MAGAKRTIRLGDAIAEVTDPALVQPVIVDAIVEARHWAGALCLSFASIINDGDDGQPEARVCARLRIPLAGALDLKNLLEKMLADQMPGKEKAN